MLSGPRITIINILEYHHREYLTNRMTYLIKCATDYIIPQKSLNSYIKEK
jgi:hypothetical protein